MRQSPVDVGLPRTSAAASRTPQKRKSSNRLVSQASGAHEFEFLPDEYGSTYSPASMSEEWLEVHTVDRYREELARIALLSGNVNTVWRDRFQNR